MMSSYGWASTSLIVFCMLSVSIGRAQTPADGFTMSKGEICLVTDYGGSGWTSYWEGKRLRSNQNVGRFSSSMFMPMAGYGLSSRLNLFAGSARIETRSSAGTMAGMKGWQDLQLEAKYRLVKRQKEKGTLYSFLTTGVSVPVSNYVPDNLPYSIGLGSRNLIIRAIFHYERKTGWFNTIQSGYIMKSKITVDRQSYFNERQVMSNVMPVPDVWDGAIRFGYKKKTFRMDLHYGWMVSTSGSDIRRHDMPYPFNRMNATTIGFTGLYWMPFLKGLAIHGNADQTITGRNMGRAFIWSAGVQYVFNPFKN